MSSLLSECLLAESNAIALAAAKLCPDKVKHSLEIIENCFENKSKLVISGVGKSGIVARKMAATFSSAGGLSIYLNPLDALHGDIGIINQNDTCILLSNSGETKEILDIIPHLKKRGIKIISLLGRYDSTIGNLSDVVLETYVDKEACPLNLAPTTSTTVAMAIGDGLATVWMKKKGITIQDFALNHPSGSLGKKISLSVKEIMIPRDKLHFLIPDDSLTKILNVITKDAIGTACVINPNKSTQLVGIITDGDLRRALEKNNSENWQSLKAKDIMTSKPITINEEMLAIEALKVMEGKFNKLIASLPIINSLDNNLIGLLRLHHLVQAGLRKI